MFAQSQDGADQTRLSIRGSGIAETSLVRGVNLLRDGLPLTQTNGQFRSEVLDPFFADYLEIYRGANALKYGAATLGGAINLVSPTGYSAPGIKLRFLGGSGTYLRPQVSAGGVSDSWDSFVAFSGTYQNGFRDHSEQKTSRLYANLGFRHSEQAETRLHFDFQDYNQKRPGSLSLAELRNDPTQADPRNLPVNARVGSQYYRAALQHTIYLNEHHHLNLGGYYQRYDLKNVGRFGTFVGPDRDVGLSARHEWKGVFAPFDLTGREQRLVSGGRIAYGYSAVDTFATEPGGSQGPKRVKRRDKPFTIELFTEYMLPVLQNLTTVIGAQGIYSRRDTHINVLPGAFGISRGEKRDFFGFNPKFGLLWEVAEGVQVFGNVNRSYELPDDFEFTNQNQEGIVTEQTATTIEVGMRRAGKNGLSWDMALYYSWVKDEILSQEIPLGSGIFLTTNADSTRHWGVELGLNWKLPLNILNRDWLDLRGAYTYSDFRYSADPAFGNNNIPGIPQHRAKFEVLYRHPSGFFFGPNVDVTSNYFVDFANTLKAPSYTIVSARAGYTPVPKSFTLFVEAQNLANLKYVTSTSITADAMGSDLRIFNPGRGRSIFAGIEWLF